MNILIANSWFCPDSIVWGNFAEWGTILMTLILSSIALFKESLINLIYKPKIKYLNVVQTHQNGQTYYRLPIQNIGDRYIEKIEYSIAKVQESNKEKRDLIPSPLNWMHLKSENNFTRDILPDQVAYLDLLLYQNNQDDPKVRIQSNLIEHLHDMVEIKAGSTKLTLIYFSNNGVKGELKLRVDWLLGQDKSGKPTVSIE